MLSLRMAHTRLGRVTRSSIWQMRARSWYSTKDKPAVSTVGKTMRYIAIGASISVPGLWWFSTHRHDEVPRLESPNPLLGANQGPSEDEVTRIISQEAYTFRVKSVAGVDRYDGARLASSSPCEDRFMHGRFPSPSGDGSHWMAWAVFDGHAGWQTADLLEKNLLFYVRRSLGHAKPTSSEGGSAAAVAAVQGAISGAFLKLDDDIIKTALATSQSAETLQDKVTRLVPAYSGSCALLSLYDPATSTLHVACTGDSRAVLGRKTPAGNWEAVPLSVDQTGSNEEEVARINSEHPGEEGIAKDGRILGIMVSRAFGDGRWKWPLDLQRDLKRKFNGPSPLTPKYDVRTPPYLTAEPVITSTKIDASKPSFLIMASDGMWGNLSNQQAVGLVGKWLESDAAERRIVKSGPTYQPFDFSGFREYLDIRFAEERTTVQDDNAAVHLVRNSLGGNHHELIASRLAFGPPFSRRLRDDMTVQVVFFANGGSVSGQRR